MPRSETTVARAQLAQRNEDQVLSENALKGERWVAVTRVALFSLMGLSQHLFRARSTMSPLVLARGAVLGFYVVFSLLTAYFVWFRAKPSAQKARLIPLAMSIVDFGFLSLLAWLDLKIDDVVWPQMYAASCAVYICFSVSRFGREAVLVSTGLGIFTFLWVASLDREVEPAPTALVVGCFIALGVLLERTNTRSRGMFLDLRKRDNLTRFLPPQVADRIMRLDDSSLAPTQRVVTVLFSDIRNFTTLSESRPPREILEFLDEYFGHMSVIVKGHEGIVNKFLGDGMLAFWGVPDTLENHAAHALKAALDMRRKLVELNEAWAREGKEPIRIGVGIHTGTVAAGMLGGADQHEYTVIGDAVNLASRIEGLTKEHGEDILVSEETARELGEGIALRRVGEAHVKGRHQPVVVFAVDSAGAAAAKASP